MAHTRLNIPNLPNWEGDQSEPADSLTEVGIAEAELMPPKNWNWLLNNQNAWLQTNALASINNFKSVTTGFSVASAAGVWDPVFRLWVFCQTNDADRSAFCYAFQNMTTTAGVFKCAIIDESGRIIIKSYFSTLYSTNGGDSWVGGQDESGMTDFYNMESAYPYSDKLVSVSDVGIYKSDSVLSTFVQPSVGLPGSYAAEDVKHVRGSFWLVLARDGSTAKVFQSWDNGDTWKDLGSEISLPTSGPRLDVNTGSQKVIAVGLVSGPLSTVYVTEDYGINWRTVGTVGYRMDTINDVVHCGGSVWLLLGEVYPTNGLGDPNPGLISIDDGETWQPINSNVNGIGKAAFMNNSQIVITLDNTDILISDHIFGGW